MPVKQSCTWLSSMVSPSWGSRCLAQANPVRNPAQRGLTIYNSSAAVFLFALIAKAIAGGLVVWAAACLHLVLAVLMIIEQRQQRSH